jgi:dienelactone hydrolase
MSTNLGSFSELTNALGFAPPEYPKIDGSGLLKHFGKLPKFPSNFEIERGKVFEHDDVSITEISWSVGWGPRTQAFLLKSIDAVTPLPGALFLHSHDDVKSVGKEKVVVGAGELPEEINWVRRDHYGDRGAANELAKRGFAVLVFDCFLWGSRRFDDSTIPDRLKELLGDSDYERLSVLQESMSISKYLSLFGATLAGLLNFDDRVAFAVAQSLPEISNSISAVGLSGGGCRAIYLHATTPELTCVVSVGAMATYESLLDIHVAPHSWMYFPQGLAAVSDWPGVAMIGVKTPLYIQFCGNDQLFTKKGMLDADVALSRYFGEKQGEYRSDFYPVKHSFTVGMQDDAFDWMKDHA